MSHAHAHTASVDIVMVFRAMSSLFSFIVLCRRYKANQETNKRANKTVFVYFLKTPITAKMSY